MQGSSSGSLNSIDPLTQLGGQNVQDHLDGNQNNTETDTLEIFQNKDNLSAEQKETLSWFFLESVFFLFQSTVRSE